MQKLYRRKEIIIFEIVELIKNAFHSNNYLLHVDYLQSYLKLTQCTKQYLIVMDEILHQFIMN